jgi:hypothetical protein
MPDEKNDTVSDKDRSSHADAATPQETSLPSRKKSGVRPYFYALTVLLLCLGLINMGRFAWVPRWPSMISLCVGVVILWVTCTRQVYVLWRDLRRIVVSSVLRGGLLRTLLFGRVWISICSVCIGAILAFHLSVFLALNVDFVPVLVLDIVVYGWLLRSLAPMAERTLTEAAASPGLRLVASLLNYLVLFAAYAAWFIYTVDPTLDPGTPKVFDRAAGFAHGFHPFEVIARFSYATDLMLQSFTNLGDIWGTLLTVTVIFSTSLGPFVAVTLLYRQFLGGYKHSRSKAEQI